MRYRVVFLIVTMVVSAAGTDTTPARALIARSTAHGPGAYFLVLGDSSNTGYHFQTYGALLGDWHCLERPALRATGVYGWTCAFLNDLERIAPTIKIVNYAINGETTCSFLAIVQCPGTTANRGASQPNYDISKASQLSVALRFLRAHPNSVSPIVLDIGGNDQSFGANGNRQDSARWRRMVRNRMTILRELRAAAPRADLLLDNNPDPAPADYQRNGVQSLWDAMLSTEVAHYGALPIDLGGPTEYWDYSFTDIQNGHASDLGQRQIAAIYWSAYDAYVHGDSPVHLNVRPVDSKARAGRPQSFLFTTAPRARVYLKLTFAGGSFSRGSVADAAGRWQESWPAGRRRGKVTVHACASTRVSSLCIDEFFILR